SGVGKALMAWLPEEELERIINERGLPRVTENTLHTPESLREGLAEIRQLGFACDREEHAIGLHCVAACIHDEHGTPLAALSVSGPAARIPEARLLELGALVRDTAAEITARLGGQVPDA
ncbi:MAG TPA: IclR family transcriptional regulator C-terminal domain-containing protein, partial [Halomonas sp.]|nr:IclR family transcriptional regulator C-terminal domain-containing protein [Halomonas sp.]